MTVLPRLRARLDVVGREAATFGLVGVFNTLLDFGVFNLCVFGFGLATLRSKVISTVVAATSSYVANRYWTFRHRARQDVHREYLLFFALNAVGLVIALAVLAAVRYGLGLDGPLELNIANVAGIGLGTIFRFVTYRRYVWKHPDAVQGAAGDGDPVAGVALDAERR